MLQEKLLHHSGDDLVDEELHEEELLQDKPIE
jgi:hypothetical protein